MSDNIFQALMAIASKLQNPTVQVTRGTSYLWANGVLIQWGTGTILGIASGAGITTGFPILYDTTPVVMLSTDDTNAWSNAVVSKATTGFVAKTGYTESNLAGSWVSIGIKATRP